VTVVHYDYTLPMVVFVGFGLCAAVFALLLKAEDKKKGYGLESPNQPSAPASDEQAAPAS